MSKVLELSDDTYQQLVDLAQQQQRTLEEMLRVCLATYEAARYERVHQQMIAEGLLAALPARPLPPDEARELLRRAPGVVVLDDPAEGVYPMIRGTMVPADMFDRATQLAEEYRASHR